MARTATGRRGPRGLLPAPGAPALRRAAVVTALAFGCAGVRPAAPDLPLQGAPPARVALAEPGLELWMEGTRAIDPEESARALAASREALAAALRGRGLDDPDPTDLLVVRARAVARTEERRSAQVASMIGIVLVVVAVVIVAVLSRDRSSRRSGPSRVSAAPPRPGPWRAPPPGAWRPRHYPPPPVGVSVGIGVVVPIEPYGPGPAAPGLAPGIVSADAADDAWLARRDWFDGDEVELALELRDARTGAVRWARALRGGADPRDARAVSALVDRALEGVPFGQRLPAAPPPTPQP